MLQDLLVAMYVTGGESIVNSAQKADRESFEPKEKKHKGITRYFAVPEEQVFRLFGPFVFGLFCFCFVVFVF